MTGILDLGYGQDTDNVYYVKSIVSTESRDVPEALKPPCDTDYKELDAATCGSVSEQKVKSVQKCIGLFSELDDFRMSLLTLLPIRSAKEPTALHTVKLFLMFWMMQSARAKTGKESKDKI